MPAKDLECGEEDVFEGEKSKLSLLNGPPVNVKSKKNSLSSFFNWRDRKKRHSETESGSGSSGHDTWLKVKKRNEKRNSDVKEEQTIEGEAVDTQNTSSSKLHSQRRTTDSDIAASEGIHLPQIRKKIMSVPDILEQEEAPHSRDRERHWDPRTKGDPTRNHTVEEDSGNCQLISVTLLKDPDQGFGFSVAGLSGESRTFINNITPEGAAER